MIEFNKAATFKGHYINEFLKIENLIERIIVSHYNSHLNTCAAFMKLSIDQRKSILVFHIPKRKKLDQFFHYILYSHPNFSTKMKLECFSATINLNSLNLYNKLQDRNFFGLIQKLNEFRNIIAHNRTNTKREFVEIIKKKKYKNQKEEEEFIPKFDNYEINDKLINEICEQLSDIQSILVSYSHGLMFNRPELKYTLIEKILNHNSFKENFGVLLIMK